MIRDTVTWSIQRIYHVYPYSIYFMRSRHHHIMTTTTTTMNDDRNNGNNVCDIGASIYTYIYVFIIYKIPWVGQSLFISLMFHEWVYGATAAVAVASAIVAVLSFLIGFCWITALHTKGKIFPWPLVILDGLILAQRAGELFALVCVLNQYFWFMDNLLFPFRLEFLLINLI